MCLEDNFIMPIVSLFLIHLSLFFIRYPTLIQPYGGACYICLHYINTNNPVFILSIFFLLSIRRSFIGTHLLFHEDSWKVAFFSSSLFQLLPCSWSLWAFTLSVQQPTSIANHRLADHPTITLAFSFTTKSLKYFVARLQCHEWHLPLTGLSINQKTMVDTTLIEDTVSKSLIPMLVQRENLVRMEVTCKECLPLSTVC